MKKEPYNTIGSLDPSHPMHLNKKNTPRQMKRQEIIKEAENFYHNWIKTHEVTQQPFKETVMQFAADFHIQQSSWISVEDELPSIGREVIVFRPEHDRRPVTALCRLIRYEEANEYHWDNVYGGNNVHLSGAVTHWMPLPPSPKK